MPTVVLNVLSGPWGTIYIFLKSRKSYALVEKWKNCILGISWYVFILLTVAIIIIMLLDLPSLSELVTM